MAKSRKTGSYDYEYHTYEYGNTVRRMEEIPSGEPDYHSERLKRRQERREAERKRRHRRAARRNRERALSMSAGYVTFLSVCAVIVALTAVAYVSLQSSLTIRQEQIAELETEISDLKIDNDMTYKRIMTSVNLKKVKKQAKKLGMRYPSQKQIVYYTVDNSDYMTQYSD